MPWRWHHPKLSSVVHLAHINTFLFNSKLIYFSKSKRTKCPCFEHLGKGRDRQSWRSKLGSQLSRTTSRPLVWPPSSSPPPAVVSFLYYLCARICFTTCNLWGGAFISPARPNVSCYRQPRDANFSLGGAPIDFNDSTFIPCGLRVKICLFNQWTVAVLMYHCSLVRF